MGKKRQLWRVVDSRVFPGTQGGPLEHVIASKAIAYQEALSDEYLSYIIHEVLLIIPGRKDSKS